MSSGPDPSPRARLHVRVEGRVQGVGFRWYVRRAADELRVGGWVRNLADGSVEVLAVGPAADVARLRERLAAGPAHARVERLVDLHCGVEPDPSTFEIRTDERS